MLDFLNNRNSVWFTAETRNSNINSLFSRKLEFIGELLWAFLEYTSLNSITYFPVYSVVLLCLTLYTNAIYYDTRNELHPVCLILAFSAEFGWKLTFNNWFFDDTSVNTVTEIGWIQVQPVQYNYFLLDRCTWYLKY
jgi:hypothetical protein